MAGPLTLKASSYPTTSATMEGLRELSTAELRDYIAHIITSEFEGVTGSPPTADLTVTAANGTLNTTNNNNIGTFTNRYRDDGVGVHPTAGAFTSDVYTFGQNKQTATENHSVRPLKWNGTDVIEMTDAEIRSEIIDEVINAMVFEDDNTTGQYKIGQTTPAGGTWTSRGEVLDTQVDGTSVTYYLWQKTAPTTTPATNRDRPVTTDTDGSVREMTDAETKALTPMFRNRIMSTGIGTYLLESTTPTATGTWAQMGTTMTDQLKDTATYAYAGSYTGSYTGYYDRYFSGYLNGSYAGSYTGTYTGYYSGLTVITTATTQETKQLFIRTA